MSCYKIYRASTPVRSDNLQDAPSPFDSLRYPFPKRLQAILTHRMERLKNEGDTLHVIQRANPGKHINIPYKNRF